METRLAIPRPDTVQFVKFLPEEKQRTAIFFGIEFKFNWSYENDCFYLESELLENLPFETSINHGDFIVKNGNYIEVIKEDNFHKSYNIIS